eukprot:gb/GECG01008095.1/.p1 GENE.gb/GECG01008095.1/~~gb/GECG01008095.1/.p1  ORF type:complete len:316 (+),score=34.57 gb/GECG01008095.1/:1-948(+)
MAKYFFKYACPRSSGMCCCSISLSPVNSNGRVMTNHNHGTNDLCPCGSKREKGMLAPQSFLEKYRDGFTKEFHGKENIVQQLMGLYIGQNSLDNRLKEVEEHHVPAQVLYLVMQKNQFDLNFYRPAKSVAGAHRTSCRALDRLEASPQDTAVFERANRNFRTYMGKLKTLYDELLKVVDNPNTGEMAKQYRTCISINGQTLQYYVEEAYDHWRRLRRHRHTLVQFGWNDAPELPPTAEVTLPGTAAAIADEDTDSPPCRLQDHPLHLDGEEDVGGERPEAAGHQAEDRGACPETLAQFAQRQKQQAGFDLDELCC